MKHLSCFSGIGGIDLAAEWAGFKTVGQVEYADYPYQVLCKHWPDVPKWRDIKDVNGDEIKRVCGNITLLSGGFPCQPHSNAGKRKGASDDRNLWPELRRVISEVRPKWFLGENVTGLLSSDSGRFFGGVLSDLAEMGYNVGWCSYEAARVGAPHRRERVFIVAYSNLCGCVHRESKELTAEGGKYALSKLKPGCQDMADTDNKPGLQESEEASPIRSGRETWDDASSSGGRYIPGADWWLSEPRLGRVAPRLPGDVDRLKALGNAVVPQQVYPILKEIAGIERSN